MFLYVYILYLGACECVAVCVCVCVCDHAKQHMRELRDTCCSQFLWMDITAELCVNFVLMVNCCEVLSVCIKLFWDRARSGAWVGAWGMMGRERGGTAFVGY